MSTTIVVIQSNEQFNLMYDEFRESAKINELGDVFLVGLDTEYISKDNNPVSFLKSLNWVYKADKIAVCKLQLATDKICFVIDICKMNRNLPENLVKILTGESWIKTGVGISNDLKYLSYNFNLGHCPGGIDVKTIAQLKGCTNPNLLDIYKSICGSTFDSTIEKIKKKEYNKECAIDWSRDMTMDQIQYAGMDAIMSYKIGRYLIDGICKGAQFDKFKVDVDYKVKNNDLDNQNSNNKLVVTTSIVCRNYIGVLQEYAQKNKLKIPTYIDAVCNDDNYRFKVLCQFNSTTTNGYGSNKKEAKINAAYNMVELLSI